MHVIQQLGLYLHGLSSTFSKKGFSLVVFKVLITRLTANWIGEKAETVDKGVKTLEILVDAEGNNHTFLLEVPSNSTPSASASADTAQEGVVAQNNRTTRKQLPSFEHGGVIVFYHIYKTGGLIEPFKVEDNCHESCQKRKHLLCGVAH
jgi:hypothetical protein